MYQVLFARKAEKQLKKFERNAQERIVAVLERARIRPQDFFERLVGEKAYKLRAGDYRAIADIDATALIILVIKVGHRENVYDR